MKKILLILSVFFYFISFSQVSRNRLKQPLYSWISRVVPTNTYLDSTFKSFHNTNDDGIVWVTKGNALGTYTAFIGTTDNRSFRIKTNGIDRFKFDSIGIARIYSTTATSTVNGAFWYDGGLSGNNGFNFYSNDIADASFLFKFGNSHNSLSYYADHTTNNWLAVPNNQNIILSNDGANTAAYSISIDQLHAWISRSYSSPISSTHVYGWTGSAYTNQTASSEISPYGMAMGSIQYASGNLPTQRGLVIDQPLITFAAGGGVISEAATESISGALRCTTNGTCTISSGLSIGSMAAVALTTNVVNGYGLYCKASTGAQNNYCASFLNGKVGIGTSSPTHSLTIVGDLSVSNSSTLTGVTNTSTMTATSATLTNARLTGTLGVVGGSSLTGVTNTGTLSSSGNATLGANVSVTGSVSVVSNVSITGTVVAANLLSGTYTPTLTNTTNVAASTAYVTGYYRVGTMVTVFGKVDIDATLSASTATELQMTLPIASNMTGEQDLGGDASSDAVASLVARIKADATSDKASIVFKSISLTNDSYSFTFSYQIK